MSVGRREVMVKRTGIILACIAVLMAVSYVSSAAGYLLGGPQYSARYMPADAAYTVVVLRAPNNRREGEA